MIKIHLVLPFIRTANLFIQNGAGGYSRRWLIIFDLRLEITFFCIFIHRSFTHIYSIGILIGILNPMIIICEDAVHNNLKRKADTNRWLFIRFLTHKKEHREPLPNAVV
ncbi:hypothetical protein ACJX0J_003284 [Zea mays]